MNLTVTHGIESSYYYIDTLDKFNIFLSTINNHLLDNPSSLIACDTETRTLFDEYGAAASWRNPHTSRVSLFQLYIEHTDYPYIIDILNIGIDETKPLINLLDYLPNRKIFFNAKFDLKVIKSTWDIWLSNVWCVMLMSQRIGVCTGFRASQMRGHSYRSVCRDYLGVDISKTEQSSDWGNKYRSPSQLDYAAIDVFSPNGSNLQHKSLLITLYKLFEEVLYTPSPLGYGGHSKLKDYQESIELDQDANFVLAKIEYTGMPISLKMLQLIHTTAEHQVDELKLYLCKSLNLPLQQTVELTPNGPKLNIILTEQTQKILNNPKQLVGIINKTLKTQLGSPLTDVQSSSLETLLKQLKVKEKEDSSEVVSDDYFFEEDDDILDSLEDEENSISVEFGIELVDKLIKYKELSKLISTTSVYLKIINPVTGRLHSNYQCIGASTGRMSSGGKESFNVQQVSKVNLIVKYKLSDDIYNTGIIVPPEEDKEVYQMVNLRYAFVVDQPGMLQSSCDYDSQEAKSIAVISECPNIKKAYLLFQDYESGRLPKPINPITGETYSDPNCDIHIIAAASINPEVKDLVDNKPWEANKDNPLVAKWRQLGKILNYALIYLAQAPTIAEQIDCTVEEAQQMIDNYFSAPNGFYGLKEWLDSTAAVATELRWIRLITGDMVFVAESNSKGMGDSNTTARKACNHACQSLCSIQTKLALVKADRELNILNNKYKDILNGRKGELISVVHN